MDSASTRSAREVVTLESAPVSAAAEQTVPREAPVGSLLDSVIASSVARSTGSRPPTLAEPWRELVHHVRSQTADESTRRRLKHQLGRAILRIDQLVTSLVDKIIHHPAFQKLEASWRGLDYLVHRTDPDEHVVIRCLDVRWSEVVKDQLNALEFDQSELFRKVYDEEFGTPGGKPFGLLIGDYEVTNHPQDVETLEKISGVAAAAFSPFVAAAAPSLLGLKRFDELERILGNKDVFDQLEYRRWKSFRESPDSRFVGLAIPRVLMRKPYLDDGSRREAFAYREDVSGQGSAKYLWGNAAYAFGAVVVRSFMESQWLANLRGVRRVAGTRALEDSGGLVAGLPVHCFDTDAREVGQKFSTDVCITDAQERTLGAYGLIPLCHCKDTEYCAFYGNQSVQSPKRYSDDAADSSSRMSAMLQYMLCASRFAHYLKVIARDKLGTFAEVETVQTMLNNWLAKYTAADAGAASEVRARCPLRRFDVQVREIKGKPGSYAATILLEPHYQLDTLVGGITLQTELAPAKQ